MGSVALVAIAGCGRIGFDPGTDEPLPSCQPDGAPAAHSTLRLDRHVPDATLVDFPLLVVLDDTRARRAVIADDGSDVRFRSRGCVLAHEIEQVGTAGGEPLLVWVRIPRYDSATVLTVEYGGTPGAASTEPMWTDAYEAFWHMTDNNTAFDATDHDRDGTAIGNLRPNPGQVGIGLEFDDTDQDHISIASGATLELAGATLSAWVKLDAQSTSPSAFTAIVTRERDNTDEDDFMLGVQEAAQGNFSVSYFTVDDNEAVEIEGPAFDFGRWVHLATTWDGSTARLYVDGELRAARPVSGSRIHTTPQPVFIGGGHNPGPGTLFEANDDFANGIIDEVRIENTARSNAWIAAEFASISDTVITYGPVEVP